MPTSHVNQYQHYNSPLHPSAYKPFTAANIATVYATNVVGSAAGYIGGCHLNGYIYLAPFVNPSANGVVARVNARSTTFSTAASTVTVQDLTSFYVGAAGFATCCTDGTYVYFSPRFMGILARYDSRLDFNSVTAWEFFDLTRVNASYKGYDGCVVFGGYLYLVPTNNGSWHGYALRFDTSANFFATTSYTVFDMTALSASCVGYIGCTTDERYVYYTPRQGASVHGVFARYDTWGSFTSASSWEIIDMGAVNAAYKGYTDATYIGGYVYYSPTTNGAYHGNVLRFDTRKSFTDSASWEAVNLATFNGLNVGYFGIGNDGRYVYLSPFYNTGYQGRAIRYDTSAPFTAAASWEALTLNGIDSNLKGFTGIVSDGFNIFYVPYYQGASYSGTVVRFSSTDTVSRAMSKSGGPSIRQSGPITLTSPQPYQVFQMTDGLWGNIFIRGRHSGASAIEASWNGGPWQSISIVGNEFMGACYGKAGMGTLTVRDANTPSNSVTCANVGVGDVFVTFGQSNASGRATNNQTYTPQGGFGGSLFGNDYLWKTWADPQDSYTNQVDRVSNDNYRYSVTVGGSCWARCINWYVYRLRPIAFIPAALGGTGITQFLPGTDHYDRNTLYGSMLHRVRTAGGKVRAVLWWQGETDALNNMAQATYNAYLDTLANAVMADLGCKLMPSTLMNCSGLTAPQQAAINNAIIEAANDNANVFMGPDLRGIPVDDVGGFHYIINATTDQVGDAWWGRIDNLLQGAGV